MWAHPNPFYCQLTTPPGPKLEEETTSIFWSINSKIRLYQILDCQGHIIIISRMTNCTQEISSSHRSSDHLHVLTLEEVYEELIANTDFFIREELFQVVMSDLSYSPSSLNIRKQSQQKMEDIANDSQKKQKSNAFRRGDNPPSTLQINQDLSSLHKTNAPILQTSKKAKHGKKVRLGKNRRPKRVKINNHPMNFFLQTFKPSFLNFIKKNIKNYKKLEIVAKIQEKEGINMNDYQQLFNHQELRPKLKLYFEQKMIFRDLMKSRIKYSLKRNYFKRIHVLQEAFNKQEFKKITY